MKKKLTFLGIETSCDETAASVVQENSDGTAKVLSIVISSICPNKIVKLPNK